jgi:tRNA (cmo5U34)-methyltransferase
MEPPLPRDRPQSMPEEMTSFFDARAFGYEAHMRSSVAAFDTLYRTVADALPNTMTCPEILDLGIGTGLQAERIFDRFTRARITGIDLSPGMLARLRAKPSLTERHLTLIQGSFLDLDLGQGAYDAVVSVMALHHWTPAIKHGLYRRIRRALRSHGVFVNGDYVADQREEDERLRSACCMPWSGPHLRHVDLPLSPDSEIHLMRRAGFTAVEILFHQPEVCVFRATVS